MKKINKLTFLSALLALSTSAQAEVGARVKIILTDSSGETPVLPVEPEPSYPSGAYYTHHDCDTLLWLANSNHQNPECYGERVLKKPDGSTGIFYWAEVYSYDGLRGNLSGISNYNVHVFYDSNKVGEEYNHDTNYFEYDPVDNPPSFNPDCYKRGPLQANFSYDGYFTGEGAFRREIFYSVEYICE